MTTARTSTDEDVIVLTEEDITDSPQAGADEAAADSDQGLPGAQRLGDTGDLDSDDETGVASAGPEGVVQASANWPEIQATFVDDPRHAVELAADVTSAALSALVTAAQQREQSLRQDWQADGTGTEELRTALQHYRELSTRLVSLSQGL